ncbi:MAG: DMT family transporter [Aliidiomarina sp.]|uniref:DMT family transporter n=1 Tax=Aliidiomarina sp. TaxID=1872439 RepID=UPI0025BAA26B|nr:DMT family transporter [Aliidiomarina sp.]MCH8502098.1 DMT family transporter [Aliidiomarina sp.]
MKGAPSQLRTAGLTSLAMLAFAANSLLCRAALIDTQIDAASFTSIRLISGALMLWLIVTIRGSSVNQPVFFAGSWRSALALFVYAAAFSFAYLSLTAATGALLLFVAVQITMIGYGLCQGERLLPLQWIGVFCAFAGLVGLLLPGLSTPPIGAALLMLAAGIAWGAYSLRGKGQGDATQVTTGNFLRAVPFTVVLSLFFLPQLQFDRIGMFYAIASGGLASGAGYALWYAVLPMLRASSAATVQLSVPVIAAFAAVLLLSEPITLRLVLTSLAILGGVALVIHAKSIQQH